MGRSSNVCYLKCSYENLYNEILIFFLQRELKGVVNVANLDVTANKDVGTRFNIRGIIFK